MAIECQETAVSHPDTTKQKHARDTQGSQALDLAETGGELVGRWFKAPGYGGKRKNVGSKVGDAVDSIGNHGLRVESIAANSLSYCHAQIGVETNSGDAHACIILVLRR